MRHEFVDWCISDCKKPIVFWCYVRKSAIHWKIVGLRTLTICNKNAYTVVFQKKNFFANCIWPFLHSSSISKIVNSLSLKAFATSSQQSSFAICNQVCRSAIQVYKFQILQLFNKSTFVVVTSRTWYYFEHFEFLSNIILDFRYLDYKMISMEL